MDKSATGLLEQQDPAQPVKKPAERKAPGQDVSPRAGRTGGLGARAERPSEGNRQKAIPQVGRGGKAPSAAAAPAEDGDSDA